MIDTFNSDKIGDYIVFLERLQLTSIIENKIGATPEAVSRYRELCRHPLPKLYNDFLLDFGVSDGGIEFCDDCDTALDSLLTFYTGQPERNYMDVPNQCVLIGLECLTGDRSLCYSDIGEPKVIVSWSQRVGAFQSQSFGHLVYSKSFIMSRFNNCGEYFRTNRGGVYAQTCQIAIQGGFLPYWFSDARCSCFCRGDADLVIWQDANGTSICYSALQSHFHLAKELAGLLGFQHMQRPV